MEDQSPAPCPPDSPAQQLSREADGVAHLLRDAVATHDARMGASLVGAARLLGQLCAVAEEGNNGPALLEAMFEEARAARRIRLTSDQLARIGLGALNPRRR